MGQFGPFQSSILQRTAQKEIVERRIGLQVEVSAEDDAADLIDGAADFIDGADFIDAAVFSAFVFSYHFIQLGEDERHLSQFDVASLHVEQDVSGNDADRTRRRWRIGKFRSKHQQYGDVVFL